MKNNIPKVMRKPKRSDFDFSLTFIKLCRRVEEKAYKKAMDEYRHEKIMSRYKPFQIFYKGVMMEEIRFLRKSDAWDYVRDNMVNPEGRKHGKRKLKDFRVFGLNHGKK